MSNNLNSIKILIIFFVFGIVVSILVFTAIVPAKTFTVVMPTESFESSVNQNGQTYGSINWDDPTRPLTPDLVCAIGIDGTLGFISMEEHDNYITKKPETYDEIKIYMDKLIQMVEEAKANNSKYLYCIPLYESDGKTVIGEYGVCIPAISYEPRSTIDD